MKKIFISILLLICSSLAFSIDWKLENGELFINGEGAIPNFENEESTPWYNVNDEIVFVKIGEGITAIGDNAFKNCRNIKFVDIADTVNYIGNSCFENCSDYRTIIIPDSVVTIGEKAFYSYDYNYVRIGNGVKSIGSKAFNTDDWIVDTIDSIVIPDETIIAEDSFVSTVKVIRRASIKRGGKL